MIKVENLKHMFSLDLKKYEEACVYRDMENALRYSARLSAVEHFLIEAGLSDWCNECRAKVDDRRNKMIELWRELNG